MYTRTRIPVVPRVCSLQHCTACGLTVPTASWLIFVWAADMDTVAHHDAFVNFLNEAGITSCRHGIVDAIGERVSRMIPGLYDKTAIKASLARVDEHK